LRANLHIDLHDLRVARYVASPELYLSARLEIGDEREGVRREQRLRHRGRERGRVGIQAALERGGGRLVLKQEPGPEGGAGLPQLVEGLAHPARLELDRNAMLVRRVRGPPDLRDPEVRGL